VVLTSTLALALNFLGKNIGVFFIFVGIYLHNIDNYQGGLHMSQDINSIIEQLAEIDSASAKIMQKAGKEKSKYAEYIHQQKQQFDDSLQAQADKEIEEFQASMDAQNKEEISRCRMECDNDISTLEQKFRDNGEQWADEIFQNIIKG
jgi:hypothetical protein